ncbi:MAG: DNA internalization-related competence protein ComEC/Rec2 [Deltaproteobacteria bacterium]|nr:DNA internalization-related competence protein ComEC/Rec2 [Deltaproteobacteria bacterium]
MRFLKRPLMVVACLLITLIIIASKFYHREFSENHIVNFIRGGSSQQHICEGWIDSSPKSLEEGNAIKLTIKIDGCKDGEILKLLDGRIQLSVNIEKERLGFEPRYGTIIRFQTHLHEPVDFKNPGGFKYKRYLQGLGIAATGFIDNPNWVAKIGVIQSHKLRRLIESWRVKIANGLDSISDADTRSLALALTIGDGSRISEDIKDDFRKSGLMHLLVISGLNVAFVAMALFFGMKKLIALIPGIAARINIFKPISAVSIAAIWFYTYITGAEVSVMRAAIMATVYLAGIILDGRPDIFTSLSVAVLIILADSPLAIYDISFQLSFIAVLSIVIIYPRFAEKFSWLNAKADETVIIKIRRYILQTAVVSISAAIGVTPLMLFYFHNSSLIGILANIMAVPWAGFIVTPVSFIISVISIMSTSLAHTPAIIFGYLIVPISKIAALAASFSAPSMIAFTPPKLSVLMFYHIAIFISLRRYLKRANIAVALCFVVLAASVILQYKWYFSKKMEVTFLDVGQGSSVVVRFPSGKIMIYDGGGSAKSDFDIGKFVIAPYLWRQGISKVDWLVASHPHSDHFKGLGFVAEQFRPEALYWSGILPEEEGDLEEWNKFITRVDKTKVPVRTVLNMPDVAALNPPALIPEGWKTNDQSIVLKIVKGDVSFLLTGDIEAGAENSMVDRVGTGLKSSVLEVPHHGSASSTTDRFLSLVAPEYAVIQAGEKNSYGFPREEVLTRLNTAGAVIYRTDVHGAVKFATDGKKLEVSHY